MDYLAIDVETANPDISSICQIGVAVFKDGALHETWESLINPVDYFDENNVRIHGIHEVNIKSAPNLRDIYPTLAPLLNGRIVVSHSAFDRASLVRACEKHDLPPLECRWLDTAKVARRAWPELSQKGYGLANVAARLKIKFQHHNALEDARTAGEILLRAIAETGLNAEQWISKNQKPAKSSAHITRQANQDGPLYGEVMVFTGSLSMTRQEAADAAAFVGCDVADNVTKKTTLLVVGDQDLDRLAGWDKSSKHRKAEELITKGHLIRIIGERDFKKLLSLNL